MRQSSLLAAAAGSLLFAPAAATATQAAPPPAKDGAVAGAESAREDGARFLSSRRNALDLPLSEEEDAFFFVVFGDRTGGPAEGVAVLADAVRETNLLGPDLVMTVGDLVEGYNGRDEWMEQMREYRGIMQRLDCRWFPVAGNHDVYWRGDGRPEREHEENYEAHFGPLWYAFRHKTAWFIVLYTDEGNLATGERNFNKPECQRMSDEQYSWLADTLQRTKDAEHVFLFCHHPRWTRGNYGDDWDKVHALLVAAGNVKGVFGGHIHRMRYDPKDGIEYFALATVGGHQEGSVPEAGYLHCFDVVTVRRDRIDRATLPVGAAFDPRAISGDTSREAPQLCAVVPFTHERPVLGADGSVDGGWRVRLANPTSRPAELMATLDSGDGRWTFTPDHVRGTLAPGEERTYDIRARRSGALDAGFDVAELCVRFDYLAEAARFGIPERRHVLDLDVSRVAAPAPPSDCERVLALSGGAHVAIPAGEIELPDGPFTLEAWVNADRFASRQGLLCKTESSEYGIFANDGKPSFSAHLAGAYVEAIAEDARMEPGRWHHVAGVFDGAELRLYLDGRLVAKRAGTGARTRNRLPLVVGGDVDRNGGATSTLDGSLDDVRLSSEARYAGASFEPRRRHAADDRTVLLLQMDGCLGPWLFDASSTGRRPAIRGGGRLAELR